MIQFPSNRTVLAAAVAAFLGWAVSLPADAQLSRGGRQGREQKQEKAPAAAEQYPQATRKPPEVRATAKIGPKLQKMGKLIDDEKPAEARALADEVLASDAANAYERAYAAQIGAQVAYDADETAASMKYLRQALEANGLDNNGHYGLMLMLAQLQMQEEQYADALATIDRFLTETRSEKPEHLVIKGNVLYRLEKYPEAVAALKQAIQASPEPRADWQQLLMASYMESGQPEEGIKLAESLAAKNPSDKRAQLNLVANYLQADAYEKAAAVMEKMRAAGQLTEDREYRNLMAAYLNSEGKEKQAIDVINEGLQKGILKPDHQTYLALAQAYYYSDQPAQAIEAYRKAAPLAQDGETYLNLARVLWQEDRIGEAKQAAQQAIAKGVKKPDDAKKILALKTGK